MGGIVVSWPGRRPVPQFPARHDRQPPAIPETQKPSSHSREEGFFSACGLAGQRRLLPAMKAAVASWKPLSEASLA